MFKDKEEELKRLEQQLLEEGPQEEDLEEEALSYEDWEEEEDPEEQPQMRSNQKLLIAVFCLTLGVLGILVYILLRFGGLL